MHASGLKYVINVLTWVYGRSLAGIAGSNSTGAWISISCGCCVLSDRRLSTGRSLVQRNPTECGVSECDPGTSRRRPRLTRIVKL